LSTKHSKIETDNIEHKSRKIDMGNMGHKTQKDRNA
jgi:hypothetical protein